VTPPEAVAEEPYAAAWSAHRGRERTLIIVMFLGLPAAILLSIAVGFLVQATTLESAIPPFVALWGVGVGLAAWRHGSLRCPRCGRPFFRGRFYWNVYAGSCMHCQLPKWSTTP